MYRTQIAVMTAHTHCSRLCHQLHGLQFNWWQAWLAVIAVATAVVILVRSVSRAISS